jgi:ATP-dependent protease ClpP protease subunit
MKTNSENKTASVKRITLPKSIFKTAEVAKAAAGQRGFKIVAASETKDNFSFAVSAQYADDSLLYACSSLISACTSAIRELEDENEPVTEACSAVIVCATVCSQHFQYFDDSSLAARIGACNELSICCEALIEALAGADFDGAVSLLSIAQNCLAQCALTAGDEAEEEDGPAHPEPENAPAAEPAITSKAKVSKVGFKNVQARRNPNWLKVVARAKASDDAPENFAMFIDGLIGESLEDDSMVAATEFKNALNKIPKGSAIDLYIKSPGGSVVDGYDIFSALQARKDEVTVHVVAALSIASIIALGGGRVLTALASEWMIHSPMCGTYGNVDDHKGSIAMLKSFGSGMADVYAAKSGQDKDTILSMMSAETWLTGKEATELGFADAIDESADESEVATACASMLSACQSEKGEPKYALAAFYSISGSHAKPGVAGTAASKSTNPQNMKVPTTAAVTPPDNTPNFEQRFNEERKARITAEVTRRAEGKVKNEHIEFWVSNALNTDNLEREQAVYTMIDELPAAKAPAGNPMAPELSQSAPCNMRVTSAGKVIQIGIKPEQQHLPMARAMTEGIKTPQARRNVLMRDWNGLIAQCMLEDKRRGITEPERSPVQAANSYTAGLITDYLQMEALTILINQWAALRAFTRDFGVDAYKPLSTSQIRFIVSGSATRTGTASDQITDYEANADTTTVPVPVVMQHMSKGIVVTQDDLMSGQRLEQAVQFALGTLANSVISAALAPLVTGGRDTSGNLVAFSAGTYNAVVTGGTFGWSTDMPRLRGYLAKSPIKSAILDPAFYSFLSNQPAFFQAGLDGSGRDTPIRFGGWSDIQENSLWPALKYAGNNSVAGLVCNPQAIGVVAGLPLTMPNSSNVLNETITQIPGPDIFVASYNWISLGKRALFASYDLMFGAAGGDATAAALLFNGAGPRS